MTSIDKWLIPHRDIDWKKEEDNHIRYKQLITALKHGTDISVTLVEIDGEHLELCTDSSSRVYVLLSGEFTFTIAGSTFAAVTEDIILIPRGEIYSFRGVGKYLVINGPAFQSGDDIYSDGVVR